MTDISMVLRRVRGIDVISSDIALKLAEMVFARHYGKEVVDAQLPLTIFDRGDRWEIVGSNVVPSSADLSDPIGGRLRIEIVKADGRIVEIVRELVSG